jgi:hypothetical protein
MTALANPTDLLANLERALETAEHLAEQVLGQPLTEESPIEISTVIDSTSNSVPPFGQIQGRSQSITSSLSNLVVDTDESGFEKPSSPE